MENVKQNQISAFTIEYSKAKVISRETLWPKALLISPLFSSASKFSDVSVELDSELAMNEALKKQEEHDFKNIVFSKNAVTVELTKDDLDGTQYESSIFYGYPLNTRLHLKFLNYMVEILHNQFANYNVLLNQSSPSLVMIDIDLMIRHLNLDTKSKTFYKSVFLDLNNRLMHSSQKIVFANGSVVNDRYVYKFEHDDDMNVFTTLFGDIFIESITKDSWKLKFDYLHLSALAGNATIQLYLLINGLARTQVIKNKSVKLSEISVSTAIKTMGLKGKSKTNVETLNDAIGYLESIGFIQNVVDDKQNGRAVVIKNIFLNAKFDLESFALREAEKKPINKFKPEILIDAKRSTDSTPANYPVVIESSEFVKVGDNLTTAEHVANLVLQWGNIGTNPEALKASIPEQAVDVAPVVEIEIDPWDVEPDFEAWEREAAEPHRAMKDYNGPYKQWPDDEIYSEFDE
jgi:hypothetical protein